MTRVVLYGRAGCHLCDETGADWSEVDIDTAQHPGRDLVGELGELVPVVEVDGVQQGYWRIDANRLRRTLTPAGPRPLA